MRLDFFLLVNTYHGHSQVKLQTLVVLFMSCIILQKRRCIIIYSRFPIGYKGCLQIFNIISNAVRNIFEHRSLHSDDCYP